MLDFEADVPDLKKYRDRVELMRTPTNLRKPLDENESNKFEFAHLADQIYLDHAANTIYMSSLIKAYQEKLVASLFSNPHSQSQSGQYTSALVSSIREKILTHLLDTSSSEYDLVFVANATAGLKLLAECIRPECFAYLIDNHTSVIGMREMTSSNHADVYCVSQSIINDNNEDDYLTFKLVKSKSDKSNKM